MPVSAVPILPGDTVTLREVALHLGGGVTSPNIQRTLKELRAGNLEAGFHEPTKQLWIPLPVQYWLTVSSDKLNDIKKNSASGRRGVFLIKPCDVADEVAKIFVGAVNQENTPISAEIMLSFHRQMSVTYEVVVSAASWATFKTANNIQSPRAANSRQGSGRPEHPSWRQVAIFAAAAILRHVSEPEQIKHASLVAAINELAVKNKTDIVGESALKQLVSEAFKLRRSAPN